MQLSCGTNALKVFRSAMIGVVTNASCVDPSPVASKVTLHIEATVYIGTITSRRGEDNSEMSI